MIPLDGPMTRSIGRRRFMATLGGAAAAWPLAVRAQQGERVRRVGVLIGGGDQFIIAAPFREGLAQLGWVEDRNLRIDYRLSFGDPGRLAADAEELVNLRPDVILAFTGPAGQAVQRRTQIIPIVFVGGGDPAEDSIVASIARPAGNMTGFANIFTSLGSIWLELLKEAVPRITRVADVFDAAFLIAAGTLRVAIDAAAAQLAITIIRTPVREPVDTERMISAFASEPNGGLLLTGALSSAKFEAIERLALKYRLPLMVGGVKSIAAGVLMSHGPDIPDLVRLASSYVDRILRGAKPSELPIRFPTKFEFVVNLKTAKALGITIPETLLATADQVIQ
jgi:putative ABC transport system substrate-binding protein